MPHSEAIENNDFVDYYELLQISPNAEAETIQRVYKMLATRYHPDNPETCDLERFLLLNQAYEVLSSPQARADYDLNYRDSHSTPISVFETKDFSAGIEGESNRRMGILCLLYNRRRSDPEQPGISLLQFESIMQIPREHLSFTIWYLKERGYLTQDEKSDFVITGDGVDYAESHLPSNRILYRLLKASESGGARMASKVEETENVGS